MKRSHLALLAISIIATIIIESCQKDYDGNPQTHNTTTTSSSTPGSDLNDLYAALKSTPQTFTVTAGATQTVYGNKGTALKFYPYSFKDKNGNIITSGTISIQLIEMYTPGDMIANKACTVTPDGYFLQSGGQINITATMGGQEVYANKYGIGFKTVDPVSTSTPMSLYYGSKPGNDSNLTWAVGSTAGQVGTISYVDSTATSPYALMYIFDSCTSFHYINCDQFNGAGPYTHLYIVAPDTSYHGYNTNVFLILPSMNSFAPNDHRGELFDAVTHKYEFTCHSSNIPIGVPYKVVVVANKNGNYYYYEHADSTVSSDMTVKAIMAPTSLADIVIKLKAQ